MTAVKRVVVEEDVSSNSSNDVESSNSEGEEEDDPSEEEKMTNAGWADSISKILKTNKPKGKKALVLSKAKKITDLPKKKPKLIGFEIENEGKIKQETDSDVSDSDSNSDTKKQPVRKKKRDILSIRVKPDILHKDRERKLQKIATKGVVQLFNAVRCQQKEIDTKLKEAGSLHVKQDRVLKSIDKRAFLDVLMGKKSENIDDIEQPNVVNNNIKENSSKSNTWDVLKDDFMMGAKMKDWDKEQEEEEEENENELEIESD